jgi:hypothetical protein
VVTKCEDDDEGQFVVRLLATLGRELIKPVALANVRFGAHNGLKSDIAPYPKSAQHATSTDAETAWTSDRRTDIAECLTDSPELRRVLKREGEAIICPALGTRFPWAAVQGTLQTISR